MRGLITTLLALCLPLALLAAKDLDQDRQLKINMLEHSKADTSRLALLVDLISITDHASPQRTIYIDRLIDEAKGLNNNKYLCEGYLSHLFMAYNEQDFQGVKMWMELLEPVARKEKLYDILFQARQCSIDMLSQSGQYELQEDLANQLLDEATKIDNKWGMVSAHISLATACENVGRYHTASEHLLKAYEQAWSLDNFEINCEILYNLVRIYSIMGDRKSEYDYLVLFDNYVKEYRSDSNPLRSYMLLISSTYINYYTEVGNRQKAKEHYQQSRLHLDHGHSDLLLSNYYSVLHDYFCMEQKYDQALNYINRAIDKADKSSSVKLEVDKARTLHLMGRSQQAAALYRESMMTMDSIKTAVLTNQVAHLREMQSIDRAALERERTRSTTHTVILVVVLTLMVLIAMVVIFMANTSIRLKKKREQMRAMAQQMESTNAIKTKFMNNISHGIKEPLSQIVTQSAQITSDQSLTPKARKELSDSVCKVADELMVTINNILDLSRLESGMMKYAISNDDVTTAIRDVVSRLPLSASSRLTIDAPQDQELMATIDHGRLFSVLRTSLSFINQGKSPKLTASVDTKHHMMTIELSARAIATSRVTQDVVINNEINRMFMEHFKGSFSMRRDEDGYKITIGVVLTPN